MQSGVCNSTHLTTCRFWNPTPVTVTDVIDILRSQKRYKKRDNINIFSKVRLSSLWMFLFSNLCSSHHQPRAGYGTTCLKISHCRPKKFFGMRWIWSRETLKKSFNALWNPLHGLVHKKKINKKYPQVADRALIAKPMTCILHWDVISGWEILNGCKM